jgi:formylmethanofuran dehydrogenase subunit E
MATTTQSKTDERCGKCGELMFEVSERGTDTVVKCTHCPTSRVPEKAVKMKGQKRGNDSIRDTAPGEG